MLDGFQNQRLSHIGLLGVSLASASAALLTLAAWRHQTDHSPLTHAAKVGSAAHWVDFVALIAVCLFSFIRSISSDFGKQGWIIVVYVSVVSAHLLLTSVLLAVAPFQKDSCEPDVSCQPLKVDYLTQVRGGLSLASPLVLFLASWALHFVAHKEEKKSKTDQEMA